MAKFKNFEMPAEELTKGGWISVEEKLPEGYDSVLVLTRWRDMEVCFFDEDDKLWFYRRGYFEQTEVIYWIPLPELPKIVKEE